MIVGDTRVFGIESGITAAYERVSFRALGFFVIHIGGLSYGRCEPDSTMLACSFDGVARRIANRGHHTASFAAKADAGTIADAVLSAVFSDEQRDSYLGVPLSIFRKMFYTESNDRMWAPDGDRAFDDGSYVLQFDDKDRVRLIGFRCTEGFCHNSDTLRDVWLPAEVFYRILQEWYDAFDAEWTAAKKELE